jgi:ElaB/YqjD/DUF883 family membrane-anchored ribosome-binding protein
MKTRNENEMKNGIKEDIGAMTEKTKEEIARMRDKAKMMREDMDEYVRSHPEKSLLMAVGVGAVLGALLTAALSNRRS